MWLLSTSFKNGKLFQVIIFKKNAYNIEGCNQKNFHFSSIFLILSRGNWEQWLRQCIYMLFKETVSKKIMYIIYNNKRKICGYYFLKHTMYIPSYIYARYFETIVLIDSAKMIF